MRLGLNCPRRVVGTGAGAASALAVACLAPTMRAKVLLPALAFSVASTVLAQDALNALDLPRVGHHAPRVHDVELQYLGLERAFEAGALSRGWMCSSL